MNSDSYELSLLSGIPLFVKQKYSELSAKDAVP